MKIPLFGKVDLRQENKGLEHHFLDKKSPNGTMLKSSVKRNGKCYAFLTKSDKSGHMSIWSGKHNVLDHLPSLSFQNLLSISGQKSIVQSIVFPVSNQHVPILSFWVRKTYTFPWRMQHFSTCDHFVIFGQENVVFSFVFPVSNQLCKKWKFHFLAKSI